MNGLRNTYNALMSDESGQDLIEYALIAGLIGVVAVATLQALATSITAVFTNIKTKLDAITG
jgi:pilus assembly protein Flp/PilA